VGGCCEIKENVKVQGTCHQVAYGIKEGLRMDRERDKQ
jgi:hypothetical protein